MKKLLLLLLLTTSVTLFSQVSIGYEVSLLPHIENDFDFNPDLQHKVLIGNGLLSISLGSIVNRQGLSKKRAEEIANTMISQKRYSLNQTYFSDNLNFGLQVNPTDWFGAYVGMIQGGKIELSDKFKDLYELTEKQGIQFGFILTPKITENVYVGAGTGWNSISNCSQIAIQLMYNIK